MLYNVVLYFDDKKSGMAERVHYADLRVNFQRRFIFFGKYYCHLDIDITNLLPKPMSKEDAELTSKIAWLAFRNNGLKRVEIQEDTPRTIPPFII
jgi:hypothetical protein